MNSLLSLALDFRASLLTSEYRIVHGLHPHLKSLVCRSVLSISLPDKAGRKEALIVSLPSSFPNERPILSVLPPNSDHPFTIDPGNGRLLAGCSPSLDRWSSQHRPSLVQVVKEALSALQHQKGVDLESMPASELERYLNDEEAMAELRDRWLRGTQGGRAMEEIRSRNLALAEENLEMQRSIEEAKNHVAIVRSSEYADVKQRFDELVARQEAVMDKVSPSLMQKELKARADEADGASAAIMDEFLNGGMTPDKFIEAYVNRRKEFHQIDLIRQSL